MESFGLVAAFLIIVGALIWRLMGHKDTTDLFPPTEPFFPEIEVPDSVDAEKDDD